MTHPGGTSIKTNYIIRSTDEYGIITGQVDVHAPIFKEQP